MAGVEHPLKLVETSFYGELKPFAQWLIVPVVAALNKDFDRSSDAAAALQFLKNSGVEYNNRDTSERRGYRNSMTIDLTVSLGGGELRKCSVRGTVAEGRLMVSRIDDFDRLYFEPTGRCLFFTYRDRPGVLGAIGATLAAAGINIDDVRNPHDSRGLNSVAILKVSQPVPPAVFRAAAEKIQALAACVVEF